MVNLVKKYKSSRSESFLLKAGIKSDINLALMKSGVTKSDQSLSSSATKIMDKVAASSTSLSNVTSAMEVKSSKNTLLISKSVRAEEKTVISTSISGTEPKENNQQSPNTPVENSKQLNAKNDPSTQRGSNIPTLAKSITSKVEAIGSSPSHDDNKTPTLSSTKGKIAPPNLLITSRDDNSTQLDPAKAIKSVHIDTPSNLC